MTQPFCLRLDRVQKSYADRLILRDLSLHVQQGEILSLLGPSGCGKTTILRLIAGLTTPDSGSIICAPDLRAQGRIGYVFQDATLMPWASVEANVALPLILQGQSRRHAHLRAHDLLMTVGLADFARAMPHELSGGMKMRAALARALVTEPSLLLMDEPFAALDEIARHTLNDDMLRLVRARDASVLFVTHSVSEAAYLSDRVAVLTQRPGALLADYVMPWQRQQSAGLRNAPQFATETARLSAALGRALDDSDLVGAA